MDAIFKLDVDFATSYSANGVAQTVCADASDDFGSRKVTITLEWQDIGTPGSTVELSLDPSFFVSQYILRPVHACSHAKCRVGMTV